MVSMYFKCPQGTVDRSKQARQKHIHVSVHVNTTFSQNPENCDLVTKTRTLHLKNSWLSSLQVVNGIRINVAAFKSRRTLVLQRPQPQQRQARAIELRKQRPSVAQWDFRRLGRSCTLPLTVLTSLASRNCYIEQTETKLNFSNTGRLACFLRKSDRFPDVTFLWMMSFVRPCCWRNRMRGLTCVARVGTGVR